MKEKKNSQRGFQLSVIKSKPIKTWSNYMQLMQSNRKRVRVSHGWFWSYFWLDDKVARASLSQSSSVVMQNSTKCELLVSLMWKPLYTPPIGKLLPRSLMLKFWGVSPNHIWLQFAYFWLRGRLCVQRKLSYPFIPTQASFRIRVN